MAKHIPPELVLREGKPVAVIVDIEEYREMLERLEDIEDLRTIESMRHDTAGDRPLDEVLAELGIDV
jgi:PHD/YefM family antitoxin component YafN of YafNO toxin-antitoxin module